MEILTESHNVNIEDNGLDYTHSAMYLRSNAKMRICNTKDARIACAWAIDRNEEQL